MMYNLSLSIQVQPISTIPIWGAVGKVYFQCKSVEWEGTVRPLGI